MKRQIIYNLRKNAYSAFSAAIELHNKPNIEYRYETVTILLLNAWELVLKAFIRKYTHKSIFKDENHTILLSDSIKIVKKYLSDKSLMDKYIEYFENIELLQEYRNSSIHFYSEVGINGVMFSLIAKNTLDFNQFCIDFFEDDPLGKNNLTILPIGFKLPFDPLDYFSKRNESYNNNVDIKNFIDKIIVRVNDLNSKKIDDSIVVGFNIYLSNIKKIDNSDLIVAIDQENYKYNVKISKKVEFSNEKGATKVFLSDDEILCNYPYSYEDVWRKCKELNEKFKKNKKFDDILKDINNDRRLCFERTHYPGNKKSAVTRRYSQEVVGLIIKEYKKGLVH